ncbi:hypothetical protein Taro_035712 [Colocasia esculenta]|uniref:Pentatricopeptide repeat-containing protein n=1 Tax=Colocasia esculenta TaxID=4460 RepID=A0A843W7H0_COLES|nr:hypothetical protein [Colocasia esculenta]
MEALSTSYEWRNPAAFFSPSPSSRRLRAGRRGILPPPSRGGCCYSSRSPSATFKSNVLLAAAAKRGPLDRALALFCLLRDRDTVTWNTVISACLREGRLRTALELFVEMLIAGKDPPDTITIRNVLKACAEASELYLGRQVHAYVSKLGGLCAEDLAVVYTCLLNLYREFGDLHVARHLFDKLPTKDVVAFTSMMASCSEAGEYDEALGIFVEMMNGEYVQGNGYALSCALHASACVHCLSIGKQVHAHVIKSNLGANVVVGTALVDMYAKCNHMEYAKSAFVCISDPNTVAWNALLDGFSCGEDALWLFLRMRTMGVTQDCMTFAGMLRACKDCSFHIIQQIHGLIIKEISGGLDVFVGSALFMNYIGQDCLHEARKVFDEILEKDTVVFKLGIAEYIKRGLKVDAVNLLYECLETAEEGSEAAITALVLGIGDLNQGRQLHALAAKIGHSGENNDFVDDALIRMYTKHHCLYEAVQLYSCLRCPDVVSWTSLISGFSQSGESNKALDLYFRNVSGGVLEPPNHYTFSCLLNMCASLLAVEEGKQIHGQIIKSDPSTCDVYVLSGLLDMYAKCGYIMEARKIFHSMQERDLVTWNAMINGFAQHGFADAAIEMFHELLALKDLEPNHITFVGVLSACSHKGMVKEGYQYFKSIRQPTVDHYACMINLVARAGRFDEAMSLLREMPFEPNEHIWTSLLAASSIHRNIKMGEYSAKHLLELNPKDPGAYTALSNIYAAAGRWSEAKQLRKLMRDQALTKSPGFSWLRIKQGAYVFLAGEGSYVTK